MLARLTFSQYRFLAARLLIASLIFEIAGFGFPVTTL